MPGRGLLAVGQAARGFEYCDTEEMAEKLYAGCDDASPSSSEGVVEVEFDREAESESAAIDSARADVEKAGFRVRSIVRLP